MRHIPMNFLYKRLHCPGNEKEKLWQRNKQQYLHAKENRYVLLSFYDTYTYWLLYTEIY